MEDVLDGILDDIASFDFKKYTNLFKKDKRYFIDITYYGSLAESYISSGDTLLSINGDKYIILYLYRHSIELDIKMLLSYHIDAEKGNNRNVPTEDTNLLEKNHNLSSLFACFCRYCGNNNIFTKHNVIIARILSNFSSHEKGENSYRYPYDRKHCLNKLIFDINKVQQFTHEFHNYCMCYMSISGGRLDLCSGYFKYKLRNIFKDINNIADKYR